MKLLVSQSIVSIQPELGPKNDERHTSAIAKSRD